MKNTAKKQKLTVGITGGIGSGKTAVTDYLMQKGITIIDADVIAREVVEQGEPALLVIKQHFGADILLDDGNLNRAKLREIIFNNAEEKQWLEQLLHPIINQRIVAQLQSAQSDYSVLSSPLLLETYQHQLVDQITVVDIDENTQIERASKRDKNSIEQIKKIIATQISRKDRLAQANFVLDNDGSLEQLYSQVDALHDTLSTLSAAPILECPECKKPARWSNKNPARPFCSKRCKLIDLGKWANEEYKIEGKLSDYEDMI